MCMPQKGFYGENNPPEDAQYLNEATGVYYKIADVDRVQLYLPNQGIWIDAGWPATSVLLHHFTKLEN